MGARLVPATAFAVLLVASTANAQRVSTHCATRDVAITTSITDKELIGCGELYTENVLWNLDRADDVLDGFATRVTRGRGAVVYVIDTGVERSHDEFQRDGGSNVIAGLDPVVELSTGIQCAGDSAVHPCYTDFILAAFTHGTAVASVIAGATTGIAPDASIVAVRVQANVKLIAGNTDADPWLRALDDIVHHAFDPATPPFRTAIVNMSASPGFTSITDPKWIEFERKMKLMIGGVDADFHADPNGKRFLFVSAAGNKPSQCTSSGDVLFYPAAAGGTIDGLITVGGIDRQDRPWADSCGGPAVDILAPAEGVLCASISGHNRYRGTAGTQDVSSGTSYAAPYVAGIAARMLETDPTLSPIELEQRIRQTASNGVAVLVEILPPAGPRRRVVRH